MIVTEQEAAKLWCPRALVSAPFSFRDSETAATCNRHGSAEPYAGTTCIGSRCMTWRWAGDLKYGTLLCHDVKAVAEPARPTRVPAAWTWSPYDEAEGSPACWVQDEESARSRLRGYCGLAYRGEP